MHTADKLNSFFPPYRAVLEYVRVITIKQVGLQTLNLFAPSAFPVLRELYCPFNHITDVDPLFGSQTLEVLDLEGNDICNRGNFLVLSTISRLTDLDLTNNLVMQFPEMSDAVWLAKAFPMLVTLNGESVRGDARPGSSVSTTASNRPSSANESWSVLQLLKTPRERPSSGRPDRQSISSACTSEKIIGLSTTEQRPTTAPRTSTQLSQVPTDPISRRTHLPPLNPPVRSLKR